MRQVMLGLGMVFWLACGGLVWADTARITVTGQGTAAARPDVAVLSLGVAARAREAAAASAAMGQDLSGVIAALDRLEIAPEDMQTQGLSLQPVYESRNNGRRSEIVGFEASSTLRVRVNGVDRVGAVLDAVLSQGANRLQGVSFEVSDQTALVLAARQAAMADARLRAETYAAAAGLVLGSVVDIREGGASSGPRPEMMMSARMAADIPVAAGEVGVSASVTVVYTLQAE